MKFNFKTALAVCKKVATGLLILVEAGERLARL